MTLIPHLIPNREDQSNGLQRVARNSIKFQKMMKGEFCQFFEMGFPEINLRRCEDHFKDYKVDRADHDTGCCDRAEGDRYEVFEVLDEAQRGDYCEC